MSEGLLGLFEERARGRRPTIAIGAGWERGDYAGKVLQAAMAVDFAEVVVVTGRDIPGSDDVTVHVSDDAEGMLVELLRSGEVDGVVRGSCSSSRVLTHLKRVFRASRLGRIALLETSDGRDFLFAPVGVDEGHTVEERLFLVREGIGLGRRLGVDLKVAVLGGGRKSDVGRHKKVDSSLNEAEEILNTVKEEGYSAIENYAILIEDAVEEGSNFIIAPDGITGNLIFRTLAYLGGGRGYGAVMTGIDRVYIDTSRAATAEEYVAAIMMASALTG
ncbi:MAG: phosphotransacetylase [Methanobacteriota archaeon]|nr:MAG: phosphotransacetylase [Euryarchaeota archaeon]